MLGIGTGGNEGGGGGGKPALVNCLKNSALRVEGGIGGGWKGSKVGAGPKFCEFDSNLDVFVTGWCW